MTNEEITEKDKKRAQLCAECGVCQRARNKQKGLAYTLVKTFEGICPFCKAYEKVYGRKAHDPVPPDEQSS